MDSKPDRIALSDGQVEALRMAYRRINRIIRERRLAQRTTTAGKADAEQQPQQEHARG